MYSLSVKNSSKEKKVLYILN